MLKPIILLGRMPYKVEYSAQLLKNGISSYKNPYKKLYADPYKFQSKILETRDLLLAHDFKKERILKEYIFFDRFKGFQDIAENSFSFVF